jgi:hypothetical protein
MFYRSFDKTTLFEKLLKKRAKSSLGRDDFALFAIK